MTRVTHLRPLAPRPADGHKGTFGRVLVIGGNAEMIGAPAFCALAAYHAGAGYVQIATPKEALLHTLALAPQAIGAGAAERRRRRGDRQSDRRRRRPGTRTAR